MLTINDGKGTQISFTASNQGQEFFTTPTAGVAPAGFTGRTVFLIGAYDEASVGSNLTSLGGFNLPSNWNVSDALTIRPSSDGKLDVSFISDGASAAEARSFPVWNSATGGMITSAGDLSGTGGPLFIGETGGQQDLSSVFGLAPGSITVMSAVPEPETYAMLLAGLGLMGAVVRRRGSRKMS
ncbi:PEP-CTERM sorting domain-containing protein [Nitrosovibrio tenuis]|uniref:PEP-CTERM sorting domain-containing protein n=1 Tax=Nitrosovibrio tenuis TaxID=1233 RepID=UPI001FDECE75|nr:PEP-CTERM sorting domain-containing protein [Nitrosovibrio tenuis]